MPLKQYGAWIRYYFGVDPDSLDEDSFCEAWATVDYCLEKNGHKAK